MAKRTSRRRTSRRVPALVPNAPIDRLSFVRKTYEKTQPWVVLDTLSVIFETIGIDHPDAELSRVEVYSQRDRVRARALCAVDGKLAEGLFSRQQVRSSFYEEDKDIPPYALAMKLLWLDPIPSPGGLRSTPMIDFLRSLIGIVEMTSFADGAMREPHEADSIFPWVARELSKLAKDVIRTDGDSFHSYLVHLASLRNRTNAIAAWAKAKRIDIMKLLLDEVLEASQDFRYSGKVRQGKVVYKFSTGWTVQELRGRRELDPEGKALSHCAGTYCKKVERGESVIYSLRDPDGVPYVTMEWQPWQKGDPPPPEESRWDGTFTQVFGHSNSIIGDPAFVDYVFTESQKNDPPLRDQAEVMEVVELIRAMVAEFIDKAKGGDIKGLLLAGVSLNDRDLTGKDLRFAKLPGANLRGVKLRGANLTGAVLEYARLHGADLTGADLTGANMTGAKLVGANLRGANLRGASLTYANLFSALYDRATTWPLGFDPIAEGAVLS